MEGKTALMKTVYLALGTIVMLVTGIAMGVMASTGAWQAAVLTLVLLIIACVLIGIGRP